LVALVLGIVAVSEARQVVAYWDAYPGNFQDMSVQALAGGTTTDRFFNYDNRSQYADATNVDWPVHVIFTRSAFVGKVETVIRNNTILDCWGGFMNLRHRDLTTTYIWSTDDGPKECETPPNNDDDCDTRHIRFYATASRQANYGGLDWRYYVLATVHRDLNECNGNFNYFPDLPHESNQDHGWGENVEGYFQHLFAGLGYTVYPDSEWLDNAENQWQEIDFGREEHYFQSDGYATVIQIPSCPTCEEPPDPPPGGE
jgi:hypothetical protein